MNKADKSFLFKSSLMAAFLVGALGAGGAHAAGLGKLTVYSAIGQPLNAEVAVTATPEELISLAARIASHDAFKDAGIEFMPALTGLRFSVVKSASGQPMLRLTTDAPLNEPFLHFLVELNWTSGRMVREYTFLLDPPEMLKVAKPAAVVTPAMTEPADMPAARPDTPPPVPARVEAPVPSAAAPVQAAAPAAKEPTASEVHVKRGDTLSKIARENLPAKIGLDQMLVSLFNKNRDAFDGDNMNRLRAGKILRVPDADEAAKATPSEARKVVLSQGADFNAYRRRLAEAAGSAAPSDTTAGQQVAGKIKPQVEEKVAPAPQADKLEVSRTETGKAPKADGKDGAVAKARLEEELVARDKSLREASERIAQLEKNLENLKKLVELKSQAGAQLQQQAAAPAKPEPVPVKPAAAPPVVSAQEPKAESAAAPVAATPAASAEPAPPPAVESPKTAVKPPPVAPPPPPAPEPSFVEDNPELVFGGGGLIALLLGYLGFSAWRKKKQAKEQSADFAETPSAMAEVTPAPVAAAPALLADDVSILGDFSESGALTSEESVDPVAEADVLMAYGRDSQAEEILLEGLKGDPERSAIHLKLLELYANRKDAERFEAVAIDVRKLSGQTGQDWDKTLALAAGLGVSLVEDTVSPAREVAAVMVEEADLPVAVEEDDSNKTVILSASPVAEMPAQAPVPAPAAGDSLDFDLDLGTTSGPAQAAAEQTAAAEPAAEEVMSLDFDFDLGSPETEAAAEVSAEAPAAEIEAAPAPADDNAIDFAFDLDAPAAETAAAETPAAPVEEASAAVAPADAIDFDIDLGEPEMAAAPAPVGSAPAGGALSDLNLDFDLDLDAGTPAVEAEVAADTAVGALEIDLPVAEAVVDVAPSEAAGSDLDLDLSLDTDDLSVPEVSANSVEALPVAGDIGEIELSDVEGLPDVVATDADSADVPDDPEVATKLELAQAYEEMGDREGARELLNEVLTEGSAAQQAAARTRLDQLDA
ncbi:MAG: FimV/HubP family polar landmark protein [Rhodocyclaceae bacterium]|nr:FimV/HubP family polar landmark protein [Rhodocyclaceae bacterium]